jgi:acyl-CoA synthetase (AMP-forming)/AMP-acid ligase II
VTAGDRVAHLDRNAAGAAELLLAATKIGAVLVPLNWRLAEPELRALLEDSRAKLVFHGPAFAETAEQLSRNGTATIDDADDCPDEEPQQRRRLRRRRAAAVHVGHDRPPQGRADDQPQPLQPDRGAARVLVGGRELGQPRGDASVSHRGDGLAARRLDVRGHQRARGRDRSGVAAGHDGVRAGHERVPRSDGAADAVGRAGRGRDAADHDPGGPREHLLRAAGKPYPWMELQIVDPATGEPLETNEIGEVQVHGSSVTPGYFDNIEETDAALDHDGWLHTGDGGYLDADGYLFLTDRIKDMIVTGAENVYPAEVEEVLAQHPDVVEVAVFGVPDERWGEIVTAAVVTKQDTDADADADELIAFARERLAGYKLPRAVHHIDEMPKTATGKVSKKDLREQYS